MTTPLWGHKIPVGHLLLVRAGFSHPTLESTGAWDACGRLQHGTAADELHSGVLRLSAPQDACEIFALGDLPRDTAVAARSRDKARPYDDRVRGGIARGDAMRELSGREFPRPRARRRRAERSGDQQRTT